MSGERRDVESKQIKGDGGTITRDERRKDKAGRGGKSQVGGAIKARTAK